jgi:anti-sigma regulatory factor (Ser/Thr protein kinase)
MRSGAAAGHHGHFHEALCYDSDDQLLATALPFLTGGVEAGEPSVVTLGDRTAGLIRAALPAGSPVTFLPNGETYSRPAGAIRSYRRLLADYVAAGATQIRIVGEVPPAGPSWDSWARYEAATNHAYDDFPLWSICAYDARLASEETLADVARTHPRTTMPHDRRLPGDAFVDPRAFLADRRAARPDPLQAATPRADLLDPAAAAARQAVRDAAPGSLTKERVDDLVVAVSEIATNAYRHGVPPVRLRVWAAPSRVVVTVTDGGDGPKDPFAGLLPATTDTAGGLGLWIAHQSCDHVALWRDDNGFTVRLTAGDLDL